MAIKSSKHFDATIKAYLDKRADEDPFFEVKYQNEKKNLKDCVTYILNKVQKMGVNGFEDDEIYGMAMHYYDEENIEVGKDIKGGQVVVNHHVKLTEEEIAEAKQKAIDAVFKEQRDKMTKKPAKKTTPPPPVKTEVTPKAEEGGLTLF